MQNSILKYFLASLAIISTGCGSPSSENSSLSRQPAQATTPLPTTILPGGGTGPINGIVEARENRTLDPGDFRSVGFPAQYAGWCQEDANRISQAQWTVETPAAGLSIQNVQSCAVGIKLEAGVWHDSPLIAVLGTLPIANGQTLRFRIFPMMRLAPRIDFPASRMPEVPDFGYNLNHNMSQYAIDANGTGHNYNCFNSDENIRIVGPTNMRFQYSPDSCSVTPARESSPRTFTIPIQAFDPSPNDSLNAQRTADFQYSISCSPVAANHPQAYRGYPFNTSLPGCSDYCWFRLEEQAPDHIKIGFVGSSAMITVPPTLNRYGQITSPGYSYSSFTFSNPNQCVQHQVDQFTPVSINLRVTSGGGTVTRTIAYAKFSVWE